MSEENDAGSQTSDDSECEEDDYGDYYNNMDDPLSDEDSEGDNQNKGDLSDNNNVKKVNQDLEYFDYSCMTIEEVDQKLYDDSIALANRLNISVGAAGLVLQAHKWKLTTILTMANQKDSFKLLNKSGVQNLPSTIQSNIISPEMECGVCLDVHPKQKLDWLSCCHTFCKDCWSSHIEYTVNGGMPDGIKCMAKECSLCCPSDFIEQFITTKYDLLQKFRKLIRNLRVSAHYQLRFCVGADCQMIMFAEVPKARLVECKNCTSTFCFDCGNSFHSPTDCETITKWLTKCRDDSETANYICANTKSCPQCHICIEKNGGCNHITCWKCKHDFCWMCLQDWKSHGNSYYACSKYLENPLIAEQSHEDRAREALKKYLFYFERWENHHRSLLLEEEARKKILKQIEAKVSRNEGTWIDWQHLLRAGELLAKCRLTLQNTYPLAYYAPQGPEKELFEYQQAQLELEIEELSWKLERVESYQRGDIENQMDVAAKRRHTLLVHFLKD